MKYKTIIFLISVLVLTTSCKPIKTVTVDKETKAVHGKKGVTQLYATVPQFDLEEAEDLNKEALTFAKSGDFKSAKEKFAEAVALEKDNPWLLANLGLAEMFLKNYDEAIGLFKKAIAIDPNNSSHHMNLGVTYNKNKQYEKAVETNLWILENEADSDTKGYVNLNIADDYQKLKKCSEAKKALKTGKELIGDRVYEIVQDLEKLDKDVEKCSS